MALSHMMFTKDSKSCSVTLRPGRFTFCYRKSSGKEMFVDVPYANVVAVQDQDSACDGSNQDCSSVTIHYVRQVASRRLRLNSLKLQSDPLSCQTLVTRLRDELSLATGRPQRLAVIINPNSGKKQGCKVFTKKIQPLFRLCGVECDVYVTKAQKEASQLLQTIDLTGVDGIVTVGGDGLYCEVMSGLLLRTQQDLGVDMHNPDAKVAPCQIPIGIIPAGSGDWVVQYLQGVRDVITSALHIVLGHTTPSNAVSVHQGGKLSAYSGLILAFGLQGDMMYDCEKFRWMGSSRYTVVPISTVLKRRTFDVEVEYYDESTGELTRTADTMYGVDTYVISKDESSGKINHLFGDSALSLYLTNKCSLNKHIQHLSRLQDDVKGVFDFDFIHKVRVQGFKVRFPRAAVSRKGEETTLKDKYYISCDGDVLKVLYTEFEVRLHRHVVPLFGDSVNSV